MHVCTIFGAGKLNRKQKSVYEWINDAHQLPVYADIYKIAVFLFNHKPPGYVTFVAHAGREIVNGLAMAIRGERRIQVQYTDALNKIEKKWQDEWGASTFGVEPPLHHEITHEVCEMIKSLIDEHRTGRERVVMRDSLSLSTFLHYDDIGLIPENFTQEWREARRWFQEHAHAREGEISSQAEIHLAKHFQVLETYLSISATSQYGRIGELDEILEETNK